jgi:hypothetical protein
MHSHDPVLHAHLHNTNKHSEQRCTAHPRCWLRGLTPPPLCNVPTSGAVMSMLKLNADSIKKNWFSSARICKSPTSSLRSQSTCHAPSFHHVHAHAAQATFRARTTMSRTLRPLDIAPTEHGKDLEVVDADGQERNVHCLAVQEVPVYHVAPNTTGPLRPQLPLLHFPTPKKSQSTLLP